MKMKIGNTLIGDGEPTYIIAEIGINHNGNEESARECIDAAADAKVNAVKFQKRYLPSLYLEDVLEHPEKYEQNFQYMIPLLKRIELSEDSYVRLKAYCEEKGMDFICTPFDPVSADFLEKIGTKAFKIASADLTNDMLLRHVAGFGKPLLLSTGMSSWDEVEYAAAVMTDEKANFALLHCRSVYPVWPRDVNLQMINKLRKFDVPVGYSGHEVGITVPLVAASMGANIIEKHITLDRRQEGPDHKVSLEPYELKRLVRDIRVADQAMGREKRYMLRGEVLNRELFSKSLIATENIPPGTTITKEMIQVKGPGKGVPPYKFSELIGRVTERDIAVGTFFQEEDLGVRTEPDFNKLFTGEWGLIARFTDYREMLAYSPKVLEFHLAERDFDIPFYPQHPINTKLVVHAPEYLGEKLMDLCSGNETIRRASVKLILKTLKLTRHIAHQFTGIPKVIAHPGAMSLRTKINPDILKTKLSQSLCEIRKDMDGSDVELLFENLPPYPWYFGGQWKGNYFMGGNEIAEFCQEEDLKICFDLSHAALYCNAKETDLAELIRMVLPYTRHLHLADGYGLDGEGVQFGEGDIDLDSIMPLFSNFKGTWVPEIWRGHLTKGRGFIEGLKWLQRWMS